MILHILAQASGLDGRHGDQWLVVMALGTLASLGVSIATLAKFMTGKGGERQVEPTQIAAIRGELAAQTDAMNGINREMGEVRAGIEGIEKRMDEQGDQLTNAFHRINAISQESSAVKARVEGLERREARHA